MNKNYEVTTSPAYKVIVSIERQELWNNFVLSWKDVAWDDYRGIDVLKEVADILLNGEPLCKNLAPLRKLFRDGYTYMLMGNAMEVLDVPNTLREIIVRDGGDTPVVVNHYDIQY